MAEHSFPGVLNEHAKRLIRIKAQQLVRHPGLNQSDRDDMEQELTWRLWEKADQFDPQRAALNTFIARVLDSAVAMILRDRRRLKRAPGFAAISLEETVHEQDGMATSGRDTLSEADLDRRTGALFREATADLERAEAISHAMRSMPPRLRDMCLRLMNGSETSVARDMGVSRRQVRNGIREIRRYFEKAGLGES